MTPRSERQRVEAVLSTLREDIESARDLVGRGREAFDADRLLRLSAEAILGRIGEAAKVLPDQVAQDVFGSDRTAWIGQRIVVDHIYHRLDYAAVWATLISDVSALADRLLRGAERLRNLNTQD